MSVPCLFAIEFGVLEFWLCRSVLKHSINKRNQSQGLPIDISVQLQACFCSYSVVSVRSLRMRLRRVGVVGGGEESRCVRCVVHLLLLRLQVSQWRCSVARRVTTLVHMLVLDG